MSGGTDLPDARKPKKTHFLCPRDEYETSDIVYNGKKVVKNRFGKMD